MYKILLLCGLLMTSFPLMAEETTTETCADGAGTIVTGVITGTKYCRSNSEMNWWNAWAWCDAQGKRLIDLNLDCGCDWSRNCNGKCPEFKTTGWVRTPGSASTAYLLIENGSLYYGGPLKRGMGYRATCK